MPCASNSAGHICTHVLCSPQQPHKWAYVSNSAPAMCAPTLPQRQGRKHIWQAPADWMLEKMTDRKLTSRIRLIFNPVGGKHVVVTLSSLRLACRLAQMSSEDMASDGKKKENEAIKDEMIKADIRGAKRSLGTTDQFKCVAVEAWWGPGGGYCHPLFQFNSVCCTHCPGPAPSLLVIACGVFFWLPSFEAAFLLAALPATNMLENREQATSKFSKYPKLRHHNLGKSVKPLGIRYRFSSTPRRSEDGLS